MADGYDSLLLRLIGSLESNTPAARQQLYSQAREILSKRLKARESPESVRSEQAKLDEAIRRVESQQVGAMFKSNGKLGSLPPAVKAAIAIPSILLAALLCIGGYFYLSGNFNPHITNSQPQAAAQPKTIDRAAAFKLLAGSSPIFKDLSLQFLVSPPQKCCWIPKHFSVQEVNDLIKSSEADFVGTAQALSKEWDIGGPLGGWLKTMRQLRVFWSTGLFDRFIVLPPLAVAQNEYWEAVLRDEWLASCPLNNSGQLGGKACRAAVAQRTVSQITGIVGDSSSARVEYTVVQKQTPFGIKAFPAFQALNPYEVNEFKDYSETLMAQLLRYDDGWRVVKVQKKE